MRTLYGILAVLAMLGSSVFAAPAAKPLPADTLKTQIETYFNGLTTLQATFAQTQSDRPHETQRGTFSLNRPQGQFLWQYTAPVKQKIVGTGTAVYYIDQSAAKGDGQITQLPIDAGLGRLLRGEKLSLSKVGFVVGPVAETSATHAITLLATPNRRDQQGLRKLTLTFTKTPTPQLASFAATDMLGVTTQVALSNPQTGVAFAKGFFAYSPPRQNR